MSTNCEMHTGFHTAFMRHVGQGRRFKVRDIAGMVGKSPSYVQKWLDGSKVPCALSLMKLMKIIGTPFTNAVLRAAGQGGAKPIDDTPACPLKAMAAGADATAYAAEAIADGKIDRNEQQIGSDKFEKAAQMWRRVTVGRL